MYPLRKLIRSNIQIHKIFKRNNGEIPSKPLGAGTFKEKIMHLYIFCAIPFVYVIFASHQIKNWVARNADENEDENGEDAD